MHHTHQREQGAIMNTRTATPTAWWKSAVVYQVYPRSFADSNGDGIGDIPGIASKLDYLKDLGVDVLWLSPAYRSPQDDNGYDISDYQDIDPMFGTLADVEMLIAELHARNMKLVMDLVVNHTSDEHPWFVESASSTDNPKRDWYIWRPPRPGHEPGTPGAEPNNWESFFSGSVWQFDEPSGEYYLHLFSKKQPDLNWENPEVRAAVAEMMRWWIARGVDGFRMDVINMISKDPALPDGVQKPGSSFGDGGVHYSYGPRIHEYLHELTREAFGDDRTRFITVGEMPRSTTEQAVLYTDAAREEVDMIFQFEHVSLDHEGAKFSVVPVSVVDLKSSLFRWQAALAEVGWNSLYWENHDQPRSVSRYGDDGKYRELSAKALATVLHLMRGTPYVYQGEELGMTNTVFSGIDDFRDIESVNYYRRETAAGRSPEDVMSGLRSHSRDNARTPMQWSAEANAGFTTGEPWIPANTNHREINAAAQQHDPDSVFAHYKRLIALRHDHPVVADGTFTPLGADDPQLFAYRRELDGTVLTVVVNLSGDPASVRDNELAGLGAVDLLLTTYPDAASATQLQPWEARVYEHVARPPATDR
jgi:oligo-1,6-glucosidase